MSYKSDLYIMLPCVIKENTGFEPIKHEQAELFLNELSETSKYEFDSFLGEKLKRHCLGEITLVCKTDDKDDPKVVGCQNAFLTMTRFHNTNFCIVFVCIPSIQVNQTFLLDQMSRCELCCLRNNREELLSLRLKEYGVEISGKPFFASCLSEYPKEAEYIISAEAFNESYDYSIQSDTISTMLKQNHSQYTHYDAYMSSYGVMYIIKDFGDSYVDRLSVECILIFIMELVILKITAINAANNAIVSAFDDGKISMKEVLRFSEEFAKSIPLWEMEHFRYLIAQEFANRVSTAFAVDSYMAEYRRNQEFLEHIINTRSLITSENEAKVLGAVATFLAIIGVLPLLYSTFLYFIEGNDFTFSQFLASFSSTMLLALSAIVIMLISKTNQKK